MLALPSYFSALAAGIIGTLIGFAIEAALAQKSDRKRDRAQLRAKAILSAWIMVVGVWLSGHAVNASLIVLGFKSSLGGASWDFAGTTEFGILLGAAGLGVAWGFWGEKSRRALSHPYLRLRFQLEQRWRMILLAAAAFSVLVSFAIVLSMLSETTQFFSVVAPFDFLLGLRWSPQIALSPEQVGSSGAFGAVPVFAGTLLITLIAMAVALPLGLFAAIYLSEYASPRTREWGKPLIEMLAGLPTVVYGFFAALVVAPYLRRAADSMGLSVASESALAAGGVMGFMILPFITSLSDDALRAVPKSLKEASLAIGATQSETIRKVVIPAAFGGLVSAVLLAVSRAIGETMIVVMAAGLFARLSFNPLDAVSTVTVQIVSLLTGDHAFDSPKTLAAFALGMTLFVLTFGLNSLALYIARRFQEHYE